MASNKKRLIVFDVEGVLIPKNRFFFEVGKKLGVTKLITFLFYGFLYEAGILKLESAFERIFKNLKGIDIDLLIETFGKIPATPYLQNFFCQLKNRNCKTALISSGIPQIIVKKLGYALGADYAYGIEVETKDRKLTGGVSGEAITKDGKLKILNEILSQENISKTDCVVVADDRNNSCIFIPQILKIGFNPDFVIRTKADRVISGKLSGILPIIDNEPRKPAFPSANDLVREDLHAAGFFMPVIASLIGIPIVTAIIVLTSIIYAISEFYRLEGHELPIISVITRHAASQSELFGFAAAPIYFAFGILITLIIFPAKPGGAAVAMFCLGDSTASIFGGLSTKSLPFNKGKTWLGSIAGFLFAFLAGTFFVPLPLALLGAAIAMIIEALPLPINDNVLVPIITGAALTLLT
jgi:HAD superfamily phosphoserine phosphatase-like hydrolase